MSDARPPEAPFVQVMLIAAGIVVAVLVVSGLSVVIPPFGDVIRTLPVVVVVLVVVTIAILIPTVRRSRRG
ncbi:MAG: hypothetical protein ACHQ15_04905 [Candidatus Limnocylindrales bacterium]